MGPFAKVKPVYFLVTILTTLVLMGLNPAHAIDFDGSWRDGFEITGPDGQVVAMEAFGAQVIVGGTFQLAGGIAVNNIALFDPATLTYTQMGDGIDRGVTDVVVYQGQPVVCQVVDTSQDPQQRIIQIWNGTQWSALGAPLSVDINSLAVLGDDLYAENYLWDGMQWVEAFTSDGDISRTTVWNNQLICSGNFADINGVIANKIVSWDGSLATALGDGFTTAPAFLFSDGTRLIAAGPLESPTLAMAKTWDGTQWINVGIPQQSGMRSYLLALGSHQGQLIASIKFSASLYGFTSLYAQGEDGMWGFVCPSQDVAINAFCELETQTLIGGAFPGLKDAASANLAGFNGTDFVSAQQPTQGLTGRVANFCVYEDKLIASGQFDYAGPMASRGAAGFDGTQWHAMTLNDTDWDLLRPFDYLCEFSHLVSYGTDLYGHLIRAEGCLTVEYLCKWNPDVGYWNCTEAYAKPTVIRGGLLYGYDYATVYDWWQEEWDPHSYSFDNSITTMSNWNGRVIVGGNFINVSGSQVNHIMALGYGALGEGLPGRVTALGTYNDDLAAAYTLGEFGYVSLWDGTQWTQLPGHVSGAISCLEQYGTHLYAGGNFTAVNGTPTRNLAWWSGHAWRPYGKGLGWEAANTWVDDMEVFDGCLYFGGRFSRAGDATSTHIACLTQPLPISTPVNNTPEPMSRELLHANVPNPFNPLTAISFTLPQSGHATLAVYDLKGRLVSRIADGQFTAGDHTFNWNGQDGAGQAMPSGVYMTRLVCNSGEQSRKITLAR